MDDRQYWHARHIGTADSVTATEIREALRDRQSRAATDLVIDTLDEFATMALTTCNNCFCGHYYGFDPVRQWA